MKRTYSYAAMTKDEVQRSTDGAFYEAINISERIIRPKRAHQDIERHYDNLLTHIRHLGG